MVETGQIDNLGEPLIAGLVRGEGPKAPCGASATIATAAMEDREQPTPPAGEMERRLVPETLALHQRVAAGFNETGLSDEACLSHVRGYLPVWAGPGSRYARLEVSKSGRVLASLRFDLRTFVSLGRSADKVRPCLTPSPLPAPHATRRDGCHHTRWTRGRVHAPGRAAPCGCARGEVAGAPDGDWREFIRAHLWDTARPVCNFWKVRVARRRHYTVYPLGAGRRARGVRAGCRASHSMDMGRTVLAGCNKSRLLQYWAR